MGYQGDMSQFQKFIEEDPQRKAQMDRYTNAARMMARGGVVRMQTGGAATGTGGDDVTGQPVTDTTATDTPAEPAPLDLGQVTTDRILILLYLQVVK